MWCSNCQQDVPLLGSASGAALRCTKCGSLAAGDLASPQSHASPQPEQADTPRPAPSQRTLHLPSLADDDWALEAELRGVQRLMASLKSRDTLRPVAVSAPPEPPPASAGPSERKKPAQPQSHALAWLVLSLGLAVFACGAVLLAWSLVAKRDDLWPVGMPLTLIGQAGLILGLVLQLDGLWTTSRSTAAALSELDGELKNVRQATTLLSTTHSGGAQSFYLHLAEGASPHLLLADLKGQMDLLAQQMARQG